MTEINVKIGSKKDFEELAKSDYTNTKNKKKSCLLVCSYLNIQSKTINEVLEKYKF